MSDSIFISLFPSLYFIIYIKIFSGIHNFCTLKTFIFEGYRNRYQPSRKELIVVPVIREIRDEDEIL